MPWEVTGPVQERTRFIEIYLTGLYTITELAERFSVSRQKLYKWLARHNADGIRGLADRSRAPLHIPHRTSNEVADAIIAFRRRFPHMGPRKIIARLTELHPDLGWPASSTAGDILRRANMVQPRERRSPPVHPFRMRSEPAEPNDLWTVDYKGHFRLGNHRYCYPLTVVDHVSRYLLACDAYPSNKGPHTHLALIGSSASTDSLARFCRTTAVRSDLPVWQGFPACRCRGSGSASGSSASCPGTRSRTAHTSGCIAR